MMLLWRLEKQRGGQLRRRLQSVEEDGDHERDVALVELGRVLAIRGAPEEQRQEEVDEIGHP